MEADWRTPGEVRNSSWVASVGGVATPLLGGFSLASVIVVSGDSASFRSVFRWVAVGLALTAFLGQVVFMTNPTMDPPVAQIKARQAEEAEEAEAPGRPGAIASPRDFGDGGPVRC